MSAAERAHERWNLDAQRVLQLCGCTLVLAKHVYFSKLCKTHRPDV